MNDAWCGCKSSSPTTSCSSSTSWRSSRYRRAGAELLFELVSQRYARAAVLITSNLPFNEWTETLGSERLTGALLDRLTHHPMSSRRKDASRASNDRAPGTFYPYGLNPPRNGRCRPIATLTGFDHASARADIR